jgi:hypothetical protein
MEVDLGPAPAELKDNEVDLGPANVDLGKAPIDEDRELSDYVPGIAATVVGGFTRGISSIDDAVWKISKAAGGLLGMDTTNPEWDDSDFRKSSVLLDKVSNYLDKYAAGHGVTGLGQIPGKVVGQFPSAAVEWEAGTPFAFMQGIADARDKGEGIWGQAWEGTKGTVKRFILGKLLDQWGTIENTLVRRGASAATLGTASAISGGSPTDVLTQAAVGAATAGYAGDRIATEGATEGAKEAASEPVPEKISNAAYKLEDGTVLEGQTHPNVFLDAEPSAQEQIEGGKAAEGFVTDKGRFVGREEALQIAQQGQQVNPETAKQYTDAGVSGLDALEMAKNQPPTKSLDQLLEEAGLNKPLMPGSPEAQQAAKIREDYANQPKPEVPTVDSIAQKVSDQIEEMKGQVKEEVPVARQALRGRQAEAYKEILQAERDKGTPEYLAQRRAKAGMKDTMQVEGNLPKLTDEEWNVLAKKNAEINKDVFELNNTSDMLNNWRTKGLIQPAEFQYLEKLLGTDVAVKMWNSSQPSPTIGQKVASMARVAWDIPRWTKLILDLGFPFRQAREITMGHPIETAKALWAIKLGLRPGKNGELMAAQITKDQENSPLADLRKQAGLRTAPVGKQFVKAGEREETGAGYRASRYVPPWMKYTEQYMGMMGNAYRTHFFDKIANEMLADNKALDESLKNEEIDKETWKKNYRSMEDFKNVAEMLNFGTGRGSLGKAEKAAPYVSLAYLSPRLLISKPQFFLKMASSTPEARAFVAKTLTTGLVNTLGIIGAGVAGGVIDKVEWNMNSANFGGFKIGDNWYNPWGTSHRWVKLLCSEITGKVTNKYGVTKPGSRVGSVQHFLRGGVYGWAELALDMGTGSTFQGQALPRSMGGPKMTKGDRLTEADEIYGILGPLAMHNMVEEFTKDQVSAQDLLNIPGETFGAFSTYKDATQSNQTYQP